MALARWQATITDDLGNVVPGASITVLSEAPGNALATLKSDRLGATPLGNPFNADSSGFAAFHTVGGSYRITASKNGFTKEWRYVGVGLSSETDGTQPGIGFLFSNTTADSDPGTGTFRFNNATLSSVSTIYIDNLSFPTGVDVSSWLTTFDDGGNSTNRGQIQLINNNGSAFFLGQVTGSVVDGTGYRKISVTPLVTFGTFTVGEVAYLTFYQKGIDGGDVVGPAGAVNGNIATFNTTTGKLIQDGGKTITSVAAGKQSIWVPAGSMEKLIASAGPSLAQFSNSALRQSYMAFDPATAEDLNFSLAMPKGWDLGNISVKFYWFHPATTTNFQVVWAFFAKSYGDNEALDGASYAGIPSAILDTGGTTNNLYISAESGGFTPAGSPAANDFIDCLVRRNATDGTDTLAVDALLLGVMIYYTTNVNTDA